MMRRKKNTRQRGTQTHGWGSMKKHRGAGHRGGRGAAGSGKRGDAKKPRYWKDAERYGKHGFASGTKRPLVTMNIGHLASILGRLEEEGLAQKEGATLTVDLSRLGVERLLAAGSIHTPLVLKVASATKRAVQKVEAAGGTVQNT
ncbi:50S ribosomal protein L15 [Candidatus Woesearchaeota archaeon]|nr:MAG: 50S ribosomal protein L15 [Candidatus Woesearchaeota archaeon]